MALFAITEKLATTDLGGQPKLVMEYSDCLTGYIHDWHLVDVRVLKDGPDIKPNTLQDYIINIRRATIILEMNEKVVIGCAAGISRSNAIALGVLVGYYKMEFYKAWDLVQSKVPRCMIDVSHIKALKKIYRVVP